MASLHDTTAVTKNVLKGIGIGIVVIIILVYLYRIGVNVYNNFFPPPPPKAEAAFGKLPPIIFPQNVTQDHFTYIKNTISGTFPTFDALEPVYQIQQPLASLLSLSATEQLIQSSDFHDQTPQQLSDTIYTWSIPVSPFKRITIDTLNLDFSMTSQYMNDQSVQAAQNLPDPDGAISMAKIFFQQLNSYPQDIDETKTKTTLLNIYQGTLIPATSLSSAQVIRVDFYQQDRNKIPIVYPSPPDSTINALIAAPATGPTVVEAHYNGKKVTDTSSTYSILTADEAFTRLQNGQAYIASYQGDTNNPGGSFTAGTKQVNITDVSLGYYMSDQKKQQYLMPVVVFKGDNGFIAYVSAVRDEWIGSPGLP